MTTAVEPARTTQISDPPVTNDPSPLRAVYTANFPEHLRQLGVSLRVTRYSLRGPGGPARGSAGAAGGSRSPRERS